MLIVVNGGNSQLSAWGCHTSGDRLLQSVRRDRLLQSVPVCCAAVRFAIVAPLFY